MTNKTMVKDMRRRRKRTGKDHAIPLKDLLRAKQAALKQREKEEKK